MAPDIQPQTHRRAGGVTWRSLLIAAALMPANAYWLVQMEIVRYTAHPTTLSVFFNVVFIILVLTGINAGLRRWRPRMALTQAELLVVYTMLAISSAIAGHDSVQVLTPTLAWPTNYSTPENRWASIFARHLPPWLMMQDPESAQAYFRGNSTFYTRRHMLAWLTPVASWTGFIVILLWVMLCINSILRRQWTHSEHLTYPLAQIPLEITNPAAALFRSRLFWIGFGIAAAVDTLNSFSFLFPSLPHIRIEHYDLGPLFTSRPWNAIGWFPVSFYPFVIGVGVLIPLEFLFSCWFFYLFWKGELIASRALGLDRDPQFPYTSAQAFGAYMSFAVFAIWIGRGYLQQVLNKALGRPSQLDDSSEAMSYRTAVLGVIAGAAALVAFSRYAGMSLWVAGTFFVIYFTLAVAVTRMRAEFGTLVHDLHFTGPDTTMTLVAGQRVFSGPDLTVMSLYYWFNRAYRSHPMPHQFEGMYMAERTGALRRSFSWAMMLAAALGTLCAFWAMLHIMYIYGARAKAHMSFGGERWGRLAQWIETPEAPRWSATVAMVVGFVMASLMQLARVRWAAWPFHPLGFAISTNWEINLVWLPLFIAWAIKVLLLRYGGLRLFRASLPFFFGLILGQFVIGSILNIVSIALGIPGNYMFWQ